MAVRVLIVAAVTVLQAVRYRVHPVRYRPAIRVRAIVPAVTVPVRTAPQAAQFLRATVPVPIHHRAIRVLRIRAAVHRLAVPIHPAAARYRPAIRVLQVRYRAAIRVAVVR